MTNLFSTKTDFANSLKDSGKKRSHTKFVSSGRLLENSDFKKFLDLYLNNTSEFFERLDGYDGYISTQQVESINYENFEEHVFFDSAVEKVNYAYDQTINYFPYDNTQYEMKQYIKSLDGFSKYVLDEKVKKSVNYLYFNGNTVVETSDKKGDLLDDYVGSDIFSNFNPKQKTFAFDFWINPTLQQPDNTVSCVFKKYSAVDNVGFVIYIDSYDQLNETCNINFFISDSAVVNCTHRLKIKTGKFQHICFDVSNFLEGDKNATFYLNGKKVANTFSGVTRTNNVSELLLNFSSDNFNQEKVFIGNSNLENVSNISFTKGFIGYIDEFRFFIGQNRTESNILKEINENINSRESLTLYYKFNEPAGNYSNNNVILDYSGSKLHGVIKNVDGQFVVTSVANYTRNDIDQNIPIPLKYENIKNNPVLFSYFSHESKEEMLAKAREYDLINPNSFWKMFPKNIFLEGSDFDNVEDVYISENIKQQNKVLGAGRPINHEIIKLISIWARFFDQIKIYIDSFSEILNFSYDSINKNKKIDGMILPLALKQLGFEFRELYPLPIREKLENKNLSYEEVTSALSIRQIQNVLWKRFILNSKDYLMAKGTKKSLKSVFNSFGLEADKFVRVREISAQNNLNINNQYESLFKNVRFLDFNRHQKIYDTANIQDGTKYYSNRLYMSSGEFSKENSSLDLDFSDKWTYEAYVKFDKNKISMFNNNQSIFRVDGRADDVTDYASPIIDVKFARKNKDVDFGEITLSIKTAQGIQSTTINKVNLFNGCIYHFTLRKSKDLNEKHRYLLEISPVSHLSYIPSRKIEIKIENDIFNDLDKVSFNIGEYEYIGNYESCFQGSVTQIRLYSIFLPKSVIDIKSKDIFYLGTGDISSIEKTNLLNIDLSKDFSDNIVTNNNKFSNINFILNPTVTDAFVYVGDDLLDNQIINKSKILFVEYTSLIKQSSEIDCISNTNKVYINSFEDENYKNLAGNKNISSTGQLNPDYLYHEDQRLYIDFSAVTFLNEDITKLISINDYFTRMVSNSSNLYEDRYVDLKQARDLYFKRLESKEDINFDMLYQVYKYFDNVLEDLLYESIPSRVNYLGFNFVYESHSLERNKYKHKNSNSRIPLSSSELLKYQNYDSSNIRYRYDDRTTVDSINVFKKI